MTSRLVALVVLLGLLAAPVAVAPQSAGKARRIGFVRSLTIPQSVLVRSDQVIQ